MNDTVVQTGTAAGGRVLLATILGSGVAMREATNVALETTGGGVGAGFDGLQWALSGFTLTLAALIPVVRGGDRSGRRKVFVIGTAWFAVASLLCGVAQDGQTLVAARVLRGVGVALLTPGHLALISASSEPRVRRAGGPVGAPGSGARPWAGASGPWR